MSPQRLMLFRGLFWFPVSAVLGAVLIWSGLQHLGNQALFFESVVRYQIFPTFLSLIIASYLPLLQAIIGSYLILGIFKRFTVLASLSLYSAFFLIQLVTLIRGLEIDCGCFGASEHPISWYSVLFAFGFCCGSVALLYHCLLNENADLGKDRMARISRKEPFSTKVRSTCPE